MDVRELLNLAKEYEKNREAEKAYMYYLEAAMSENDSESVYKLAEMYLDGTYVNEDLDKAAHYFELAYERGYDLPKWLYVFIGSNYMTGGEGFGKNVDSAMKWYQMAIDSGIDYAWACMGEIYFMGDGVEPDYKKAYEYFKRSGEDASLPLYYLGQMYESGLYVNKDVEKAKSYYRRIIESSKKHEDLHYLLALEHLSKL